LTVTPEPGDVLLVHGFTGRRTLPNRGRELGLAAGFYYQRADEPVELAALQPHHYGNGWMGSWGELSREWRSLHCISLPEPLDVATVEPDRLPPSRLLSLPAGAAPHPGAEAAAIR
jgi:hypothetical protein